MRQVFHGDRVAARVDSVDDRGRREGVIVEVLEARTWQTVGRLFRESGISFVVPENARINHEVLIPEEHCGEAYHGQYVVVEILRQPSKRTQPTGKILEVLGDHMAPGMEIDVAIRSYEIPHSWPSAVGEQAAAIPAEVAEKDKSNRVDIRNMRLVTIDDESARDFDDAIYCEPRPAVAIASLLPLPMCRTTCVPAPRWTRRPFAGATRCISRTTWCRCCRRSSPTACVR